MPASLRPPTRRPTLAGEHHGREGRTPPPGRRRLGGLGRRALSVFLLSAGLLVAGTAAAEAHVHVHPDSTAAGSDAELTFTVPSESVSAGTVKLSVTLPQDHPFLEVSARQTPGWSVTTAEATLPKPVSVEGTTLTKAIRTVTWTADKGVQIPPEQYQDFAISVGPLPDSGTVSMPATQTYSDGSVVRWDQPTPASGAEPEHPAPQFMITSAGGSETSSTVSASPGSGMASPSTSAAASSAPAGQDAATTSGAGTDPLARGLAGTGLAVAVVAAVLGVVALVRGRRGGAA